VLPLFFKTQLYLLSFILLWAKHSSWRLQESVINH
jgi:hypothetical protein